MPDRKKGGQRGILRIEYGIMSQDSKASIRQALQGIWSADRRARDSTTALSDEGVFAR